MGFTAGRREKTTELLAAGILFLVFAALTLAIILFAGNGYAGITGDLEQTYGQRTVLSYVANQLRQHDQIHCISVEERQGTSVLVLKESADGLPYETMIYWKDGMVYELFAAAGADIPLSSGTQVLPADFLSFHEKDGQISVKTGWKGKFSQSVYTLRSGMHENEK